MGNHAHRNCIENHILQIRNIKEVDGQVFTTDIYLIDAEYIMDGSNLTTTSARCLLSIYPPTNPTTLVAE